MQELKDAFGDQLIDYEINGPVFQYFGNACEVKTATIQDSLKATANLILAEIDTDCGVAIYTITPHKIRYAVLPSGKTNVIEAVVTGPDETLFKLPEEMLDYLNWTIDDELYWKADINLDGALLRKV